MCGVELNNSVELSIRVRSLRLHVWMDGIVAQRENSYCLSGILYLLLVLSVREREPVASQYFHTFYNNIICFKIGAHFIHVSVYLPLDIVRYSNASHNGYHCWWWDLMVFYFIFHYLVYFYLIRKWLFLYEF